MTIQVERDPRTGAAVVTSVAPLSTIDGAPLATTVFDDGRKTIHTVGCPGGQPPDQELGEILSIIDEIGMKVLLVEVKVTPNKSDAKKEKTAAPEAKSFSPCHVISGKEDVQFVSSRSYNLEPELLKVGYSASMGNKGDTKEDRSMMMVRDVAGNEENQSWEQCQVNVVSLGCSDSKSDQNHSQDNYEGMIAVERVIITDDGEEHILGVSVLPEVVKESQNHLFQDIPLEENGETEVKTQAEERDKGLHKSSLASIAEGEGTSKRKPCQCCSVM